MADIDLLREWADARGKGLYGIDTEINYLQEHLLGEDVQCQYCCDDGDGHYYRRSLDFDHLLDIYCDEKVSPEIPADLEPFALELRKSMQKDLDEWKKK